MADISQEQYEKYRQKLKQMRMMDDTLMKCVFKDCKPAVELVLRVILQRDDLEVISFDISKEIRTSKVIQSVWMLSRQIRTASNTTLRSSGTAKERILNGFVFTMR